jgi:putative tributyrin esterase
MILRGTFFSKTLEMETAISVLVPNRSLGAKPSKVVYLLHGLCGRSGDWLDYTMLPAYAEEYDAAFIMPEVARSFYTDMAFGQDYFSYIVDELPLVSRNVFNVSPRREDTLVVGASMGGYGALKCALSRPEQYGYCAAFSSACLFLKEGLDRQRAEGETEAFRKRYGDRIINDFQSIFGVGLEWKPEYEILELAKGIADLEKKPEIYVTCGTEDPFHADNKRFEAEMGKMPYVFSYREWPGIHDWRFFDRALERALSHYWGGDQAGRAGRDERNL